MRLVLPINDMEKAQSVKYIRRWPKSTGKGWNYLYPKDFLHPFKVLKEVLGVQEKKIESDYEKNNISKDFGVDKKTFAAHVLEYLTNKTKWDHFFTKKENREKYKKPIRQSVLTIKAWWRCSWNTANSAGLVMWMNGAAPYRSMSWRMA